VLDVLDLAVADDHVGVAGEDRLDELDDVAAVVLVVGVGVDDDVGAELERASRPAWKPEARPLLFVSRTTWSTPCSRATSIVRSVEPSSMISHSTAVEALDLAREVAQRDGEGVLLVQARDLDDQLHGRKRTLPSGAHGECGTHPRSGQGYSAPQSTCRPLAKAAFALLCVGCLVGFLVFPTYPNYDSYYSLLWGREVLDLQAPYFEGFRVPTEHPLAIAAGALLSLLGESATACGWR
jgi:hypothetical protein